MVHHLRLGGPASDYSVSGNLADLVIETGDGRFDGALAARCEVLQLRFAVDDRAPVRNKPRGASNEFVTREWSAYIDAVLSIWEDQAPGGWLIGRRNLQLQQRKLWLLTIAAQAGARIPELRIINDARQLPKSEGLWVAKAINSWEEISEGIYFNTRLLDRRTLEALSQTKFEAPLMLQKYIAHDTEFRVYIADEACLVLQMDKVVHGGVDYRLIEPHDLNAFASKVPATIEEILRTIMHALGLRYCCFDIAYDGADYWLLDVNPNGSWDWHEEVFDFPLTSDILRSGIGE